LDVNGRGDEGIRSNSSLLTGFRSMFDDVNIVNSNDTTCTDSNIVRVKEASFAGRDCMS
jgi:hypothetical protein